MLKPKVLDYIVLMPNVLPDAVCDQIVVEYAEAPVWRSAVVGSGQVVDTSIRNVDICPISTDVVIQANPETRRALDNFIFAAVGGALRHYRDQFPECQVSKDSGYDLLRYREGGLYTKHTDLFEHNAREVSCSLALNNGFSGGEFSFFDGEHEVLVPKGAALLFPSNFMYPHEIKRVASGVRYSLITWFI